MLFQGITLTDAQRTSVDSIHASAVGRMTATRARADSAVRAERWAAAAERQAAMRSVLTPEQQAVWDRNVTEMRARQDQMRADRMRMRADRARMGAYRARMRADRAWTSGYRHHRW
jgi:hypothetical protein